MNLAESSDSFSSKPPHFIIQTTSLLVQIAAAVINSLGRVGPSSLYLTSIKLVDLLASHQ
jgi:hypothetical protein